MAARYSCPRRRARWSPTASPTAWRSGALGSYRLQGPPGRRAHPSARDARSAGVVPATARARRSPRPPPAGGNDVHRSRRGARGADPAGHRAAPAHADRPGRSRQDAARSANGCGGRRPIRGRCVLRGPGVDPGSGAAARRARLGAQPRRGRVSSDGGCRARLAPRARAAARPRQPRADRRRGTGARRTCSPPLRGCG